MMHPDEVATSTEQVGRLVAEQFPLWAGLPITAVPPVGTDHALYRIGDDLLARLPRIGWAAGQAETDRRWLPVLAPHLPLEVPVPLALGEPGEGFPWRWTVVPWLIGANPAPGSLDPVRTAADLAGFVRALRGIATDGAPVKTGSERGGPLRARDVATRDAITALGDRVDARAVTAVWDDALAADPWPGPPQWIHGDLRPGNLLARDGRLSGVIDFGPLGIGDPAPDLLPAWALLDPVGRTRLRDLLGCDEHTWRRGRGNALSAALIALPYYWRTNPEIVTDARHTIAAVIADFG